MAGVPSCGPTSQSTPACVICAMRPPAPGATSTVNAPEPMRTSSPGDIGCLDEGGALSIVARSKDLIIRSGFNVYPLEVESVINAWPGVRLSAVVGRVQADKNEEVVAFVEALPGASIDIPGLMAHLRTQLAPYKQPAQIIPIDVIPTTVSGKIQKQPLRARLL